MIKEKQKGKGVYVFRQFRDGKLIAKREVENLTTYEGQDHALDVTFNSATQLTTWYGGLIDNSGFSGIVIGDTMSSHAGWAEFVAYSGGARKTWGSGAASSGSVTNSSAMSFTMTGAGTLAGAFITSSPTLSGTAGKLWSGVALVLPLVVAIADVIQVTYTYTLT